MRASARLRRGRSVDRTIATTGVVVVLGLASILTGCGSDPGPRPDPGGAATPNAGSLALEGSWEGEVESPRGPTFVTVHLERDGAQRSGSLVALGREHGFEEVVPTPDGRRAVLVPGPDGVALELVRDDGRLTGSLIERGRAYPLTLVPVPRYPEPADRAEAWRQDLDALAGRFLRFDRSFTAAERALFRERVSDLRERVPDLHDSEIRMEMAAAVALSGNAHTRLYLLRNRTELRRLPIRLWWFDDGVRIVRAASRHREMLGCRVTGIEGTPVRRVRDRVAAAFAGNPSWTDYKSVYYLTSPEALHGLGVAPDPERIGFGLADCGPGEVVRFLEPLPLERTTDPVEAWWDLSPRRSESGWTHVLDTPAVKTPRYLRHPDRHYWFEHLEDAGVLYVHYSRSSEMEEEGTAEFGERLLAELRARDVRAFVLDLRFNTGGNLDLARDLMAELQEETRGMQRFVITGRATFSAGITHAASWAAAGDVTFVGEAVGEGLDFWSEGGNIVLPNSGLAAHFANGFHSYSTAPCPDDVPCFLDLSAPDLRPDVSVDLRWSDFAAGDDPALDAILSRLR